MPEDPLQRAVAEGEVPDQIPILPLSGAVLFPQVLVPLILTEPTMVALIKRALGTAGQLALVTVRPGRSSEEEDAQDPPFYSVGTLGVILQHGELPDGSMRLLIHGRSRLRVERCVHEGQHWFAAVAQISTPAEEGTRLHALHRIVLGQFLELLSALPQMGEELRELLVQIRDPGQLADFISAHLNLDIEKKQALLEEISVVRRLERLAGILSEEQKVLEYGTQIQQKLKDEVEKTQREFWLREQLRIIQQELGETEESDAIQLRRQIEAAGLPDAAKEQADRELKRLERTLPQAPDYHIVRSYLEWLAALPWSSESGEEIDLKRAREVLDRDHYDREEVKERIIEYLAVRKLNPELHGPILCFVGPPGVGKTSLGQSIASALGRSFTRISLGGIRDEAEIRGHRRTYIGALPGRILRGLRQVGKRDPVFVLDEIDKIGQDFRGDPAAALLEVLDPAQNHSFSDHYLEVAFDLSRVTFIATANTLQTVPAALQDRLEVIELPGYTTLEKAEIARRHLIPRQLEQSGLPEGAAVILDPALDRLISEYTREAGVRELERQIARMLRRVALRRVEAEVAGEVAGADTVTAARVEGTAAATPATTGHDTGNLAPEEIGLENLADYVGKARYTHELAGRLDEVGTATALAYSPEGGQILFVEAVSLPGGGEIRLTGQLGDVMKESAQAALSYVESHAATLGIGSGSFAERDVHVHVPAGATPKDGPSAGVALVVALASLFSGRAVRRDVAMTGEVTLRGHVLPVGGTKEKLIAAAQAGIKTILLPRRNEADLDEVPQEMREQLKFILIDDVGEALRHALKPSAERGPESTAETAP